MAWCLTLRFSLNMTKVNDQSQIKAIVYWVISHLGYCLNWVKNWNCSWCKHTQCLSAEL